MEVTWAALIPIFIAIIGVIIVYASKVSKVEGRIETFLDLNPELKKAEELLKEFKELKTPEDIKEAVSEELKTINITPEAINVRIEKGLKKELSAVDKMVTTLVAQKLEEADKRFKKFVGDPSDYLKLGDASIFMQGNYDKAIEYYEKAIELKQDYAKAWYSKGLALHKLGRDEKALKAYEEALKAYDKATELKQDDANAWYGKGLALHELGRDEEARKAYEEALKAYDKATELKQDDWYNKGFALFKLGRREEAGKAFEKAKELWSQK